MLRDDKLITQERFGDIAAHESELVKFSMSIEKSELLNSTSCGDILRFNYVVGGGGGHSLSITNAKLKLYPFSRAKSARK